MFKQLFEKKKSPRLKVIVTGGPRCGTSFLASLICKMGFNPGSSKNLKQPDEHNIFGYFEHLRLLEISQKILNDLQIDYHYKIKYLPVGWTKDFNREKSEILRWVNKDKIDIYKGNRLLLLSDIYYELFPEAKWICITRDIEETYQSRFGNFITFNDWKLITYQRNKSWHQSVACQQALNINYEEFDKDLNKIIYKIVDFLELDISEKQLVECRKIFVPKKCRIK